MVTPTTAATTGPIKTRKKKSFYVVSFDIATTKLPPTLSHWSKHENSYIQKVARKSRPAKPLTKMTATLTRVDANAQLQLMVGKMTHAKYNHVTEEFQSHARDLTRVFDPVQLGTTADNHVCITDSLHLPKIGSRFS